MEAYKSRGVIQSIDDQVLLSYNCEIDYVNDSDISLTLYSVNEKVLNRFKTNGFAKVMHLECGIGHVTLLEVMYFKSEKKGPDGLFDVPFIVNRVIWGDFIQGADTKEFIQVATEISNLNEWAGLNIKLLPNKYKINSTEVSFIVQNKLITFKSRNVKYTLHSIVFDNEVGEDTNFKVYRSLVLAFDSAVSLEEILIEIQNFLDFFTFITGKKQVIEEYKLMKKEAKKYLGFSEGFLNNERYEVKTINSEDFIIPFELIKDNLAVWYEKYLKLKVDLYLLLNLYLPTKDYEKKDIIYKFFDLVTALEYYIRSKDRLNQGFLDEKIFIELKNKIKASIESMKKDIRKPLREKIYSGFSMNGNNRTLNQNIIELLKIKKTLHKMYIDDFQLFSENVVKNRNVIAHAKPRSNLTGDISKLTYNLKIFTTVIILLELNVEDNIIKKIIKRMLASKYWELIS